MEDNMHNDHHLSQWIQRGFECSSDHHIMIYHKDGLLRGKKQTIKSNNATQDFDSLSDSDIEWIYSNGILLLGEKEKYYSNEKPERMLNCLISRIENNAARWCTRQRASQLTIKQENSAEAVQMLALQRIHTFSGRQDVFGDLDSLPLSNEGKMFLYLHKRYTEDKEFMINVHMPEEYQHCNPRQMWAISIPDNHELEFITSDLGVVKEGQYVFSPFSKRVGVILMWAQGELFELERLIKFLNTAIWRSAEEYIYSSKEGGTDSLLLNSQHRQRRALEICYKDYNL